MKTGMDKGWCCKSTMWEVLGRWWEPCWERQFWTSVFNHLMVLWPVAFRVALEWKSSWRDAVGTLPGKPCRAGVRELKSNAKKTTSWKCTRKFWKDERKHTGVVELGGVHWQLMVLPCAFHTCIPVDVSFWKRSANVTWNNWSPVGTSSCQWLSWLLL